MEKDPIDAKFTPNVVAQLSGHKNFKSLDSYMKQMSLSFKSKHPHYL